MGKRGQRHNPCLDFHAKAQYSEACSVFNSSNCTLDRYGGRISHLKPFGSEMDVSVQRQLCSSFVQDFFHHDLMLRQWRSSRHCFNLVRDTKRWGLLTSFSRASQLGADVSGEWLSFD